MTATIVNAAPMTIMLGTQDKSTRALVAEPEVLPTHLPMVYIYAKEGPTDPQLVVGASRSKMYGEDSFDLRKPWATHATVLSNIINAKGNSQMIQRVKPADAAPPASVRLYLDVLPTKVQRYERNTDGSFTTDAAGDKIPLASGPVDGYVVKWVAAEVPTVGGESQFGLGNIVAGDQVDEVTQVQSQRYPIKDLQVPHFGGAGNLKGLRLWAPTAESSQPVDQRIVSQEKVYPFRMACVAKADDISTPSIVETQSAEQYVNVCLKPGVINRNTDSELYVGDVFIQAYQNLNSENLPPQWGPFGRLHVYGDNVQTLLDLFYAAELPFINQFSDFTGEADEAYRFNLISGQSSYGVAYDSFQVVTGAANSVRLSENSTIYARGGSDGTMNEELFAQLVKEAVVEFANPNSILQDSARYPVSIVYDSGFPLATKYALCSFIAARKDTAVVLATHDVLGKSLSASEESSLAIALRTRLQMYPESEFFGTSTMRGMIVGRSGKLIGSQYKKHLPLSLEIASKASEYMGAGNGKWKAGFSFDRAPASEVSMFTDVNVTFTPATVRNKDWDNGLVWVESFGRRSLYFPALKTVYDNDTSILNSFFTMMACVELQKVGERARRQFSGSSSLSNGQLVERVNQFVVDNTIGRFDDRFVVEPDAYFTAADLARGYSWTLRIKLYAPNMKTVMTLSIEAYRLDDLAAQ